MKRLASWLALGVLVFLVGCGDADNANQIAQEQQQRSMYGPGAEQQQLNPPPGNAAPPHETVPGEVPDEH